MGFGLKLVTPPAAEPVSLTEFKAQARISGDDEDTLHANIIIPAARAWCEKYTGRAFVTQTWRLTLDCLPDSLELFPFPVQSVSSITYVATDEVVTTLDAADYRVDTDNEPGLIEPIYGTTYPLALDVVGSVKVTFIAGYGEPEDVPAPIKMAILMLAAEWHMNRENMELEHASSTVTRLLSPYWTGLYCPTPEG